MAFHATQYIANCFRDPQAFLVASTVARATRHSHAVPKYDFYERAIKRTFYGTLGGAASIPFQGVPEILFLEQHRHGLASKIWGRITTIASSVTNSLFDWIGKHSHVVVYIAGLAFVLTAGKIVYSSWIAPALESNSEEAIDEQDASAIQAMGLKPRERLLQQKSDLTAPVPDVQPILPALPLCQVCKEAPPSYACTECGNLVLCSDHLEKYTSTFGFRCPICRDTASRFLRIKIPGIGDSR